MTPRERIDAAIRGDEVDRVPISLWRHFPEADDTVDGLVNATVSFQRTFQSDFVKLMPTGMYSVVDYGVQIERPGDPGGSSRFVSGPITYPEDWGRLPSASPDRGVLAEQVAVTARVRAKLGDDIPIIQTVFGPLTMAAKACGEPDLLRRHLEESPDNVLAALDQFLQDIIAFATSCISAGADGLFFATQLANRTTIGEELYRQYGVPYDLQALHAVRDGTSFNLLHLHGEEPLFDLADSCPVDAVNWHDRETPPSLQQGHTQTERCLVGGIRQSGLIRSGSPEDIRNEVRDAIRQTGGRRHIVAPGCVIPRDTPAENFHAAIEAARNPVG